MSDSSASSSSSPSMRKADDSSSIDGRPSKLAKLDSIPPNPDTNDSTLTSIEFTTRNGTSYRSIGVLCSPELAQQAAKDDDTKSVRIDRFAALPKEVVLRVLQSAFASETLEAERAVEEADKRGTGWLSKSQSHILRARKRARYSVLKRLMAVNRLWHHLILPFLWSTLDISHYSEYTGNHLIQLHNLLQKRSAVLLPQPPGAATAKGRNGAEATTELSQQQQKKKTKADKQRKPPPDPSIPIFGTLVRSVVLGTHRDSIAYLCVHFLPLLPNLQTIIFPHDLHASNLYLQAFSKNAGSALRIVDHLSFASTAANDDPVTRVEHIINLFNHAPNIEKFGVIGSLNLTGLVGKRLAFIWKLNANLKHPGSGALGVGLKELYFGNDVSMTVGFLRGLPEAAPRLTKLHIKSGVKIFSDTTPLGRTPFDLAAFAAQWGALTALTIVGNEAFSTSGTLDAVLKVCPKLRTLHLRADFITYDFFQTLAHDLVSKPECPASTATAEGGNGSATTASRALLEASKKHNGRADEQLVHPLELLVIACRFSDSTTRPATTTSSLSIPRSQLLAFSLVVLSFQACGLVYPGEIGGMRDLLRRAGLMVNLEAERRRREKKKKTRRRRGEGGGEGGGEAMEVGGESEVNCENEVEGESEVEEVGGVASDGFETDVDVCECDY
ncbi:hypothetical protein JCM5296_003966 [Sporobolomyces johnsonii]